MVEISIVIPCYNSQEFIGRCITSILNQTFQNFEVILVDDGSINRDIENVKYYSDKIRLICNPHLGVSAARNKGMSVATGRYLMFVDSDDEILPNALETALVCIKKYDVDAVFYNAYTQEQGQIKIENRKFIHGRSNHFAERIVDGSTYFVESILSNTYLESPCLYLINTDIVKKYPFPCGMFYEDSVMTTKLLLSNELKRILCIQDRLYVRWARSNSVTLSPKTLLHYRSIYAVCEFLSHIARTYSHSSERVCLILYLRSFLARLIVCASEVNITILDRIEFFRLVYRCHLLPKKSKIGFSVDMLLVSVLTGCVKPIADFKKNYSRLKWQK